METFLGKYSEDNIMLCGLTNFGSVHTHKLFFEEHIFASLLKNLETDSLCGCISSDDVIRQRYLLGAKNDSSRLVTGQAESQHDGK